MSVSSINNPAVSSRVLVIHGCKEMMPEASDKGSQPYSRAYGYGEMAGMGLPQ
jgi:hypothetical protein